MIPGTGDRDGARSPATGALYRPGRAHRGWRYALSNCVAPTDRRIDIVAIGLIAAATVAGLLQWSELPSRLAIHWSGGAPDTFVSKPLAIVGLFAFGMGMVAFVRLAPEWMTNTPGGENASVLFLGVVFAWVQGIVVVWNLGYRFDVGLAVLPVLLLAGVLVAYSRLGTSIR